MCGIVAYIGSNQAYPILIKGLQRLEYRGYDSAGVALNVGGMKVFKKKGKVKDLEDFVATESKVSNVGIGHTRWATHGVPNDINAHPHVSGNHRLSIVHNGIIENYALLKEALEKEGHVFSSETDTEVLIHLIEEVQEKDELPLEEAVRIALTRVIGAYAIVIMDRDNPNQLVAARKASPLVIGVGENEFFVASDATPIIEYTNQVIYLNDNEIASINLNKGLQIRSIENIVQTPSIEQIDMKIEQLEKGGYDHFMLKEIFEQPKTISDCMRGRLNTNEGWISLGGVQENLNKIIKANRFIIAACGTSWHAGLIAEYLFEDLARTPVEVEYASELRYRNPIINENDVVIAISQSGETADTLAALKYCKRSRCLDIRNCKCSRFIYCQNYRCWILHSRWA